MLVRWCLQVISKRKLTTPEEVEDVKREVQIMHHLTGHKNVVALKGVYEDKSNVCLAMEVRACVRACGWMGGWVGR